MSSESPDDDTTRFAMATVTTDSEFLYRAAFAPGAMEGFLADKDNMSNILHFTDCDEVDIYDAVDLRLRPELQQTGKR